MSEAAGKFAKLVNELSQATKEGKLAWEDTADEEEFRAVLKPGMVRVGRRAPYFEEGDRMTYYVVTLLNREGRVAEEFVAREPTVSERSAELFELARRSALKGNDLLDNLLADLEKRLVKS
jgi:hypothetical protein